MKIKTAKEIAKLYHDAVQQAMPAVAPGATVLGLDPRPIEDGFLDSFQQILLVCFVLID